MVQQANPAGYKIDYYNPSTSAQRWNGRNARNDPCCSWPAVAGRRPAPPSGSRRNDCEHSSPLGRISVRTPQVRANDGGRMRTMLRTLALSFVIIVSAQSPAPAQPTPWRPFRDFATGISFKYPPEWHVRTIGLGRGARVRVAELVARDDPCSFQALTVDVVTCGDQMTPCFDEKWYRDVCHSFETFAVGNARAFQCVSFGSAACHWSAVVLRGNRQVTIMTPASDHQANNETHGRKECAARLVTNRDKSPLRDPGVVQVRPTAATASMSGGAIGPLVYCCK